MSQRTDVIDDSKKYFCIGECALLKGVGEHAYHPCWSDMHRGSPWALWSRLWVHKNFSAETLCHFEWGYSIGTAKL
jgi:hypothetical protein